MTSARGWFTLGAHAGPPARLDDPFNRYQLALTLEKQGRPLEAAAELERALARPDREARDRRNRADAEARLRRLGTVDSKRR